jgi:hypothetical protein
VNHHDTEDSPLAGPHRCDERRAPRLLHPGRHCACHARPCPIIQHERLLSCAELLSAELAGQKVGFSIVRLTFNDVATDETLVSARFTAADGSVMTQNIGGTTTTGQRVVDLYAQGTVASVKINYMFADPTTAAICGCTFGPYSATLSVASGSTGTTSNKGKGHK